MNIDVESVVRENIERTFHMSLATAKDNRPWVCEVHFAYDEKLNLYYRSLPTRRHSHEIAANPHVAGNIIDKYDLGQSPVGVYFEGVAQMLGPGDERDVAFACINQRLKTGDDILKQADDPNDHQFYKIKVTNWYVFGRFGGDSAQKYGIEWNSVNS